MILIKNGNVHFPEGKTEKTDILIDQTKIINIGKNLTSDADVIDAAGCEVFPGFILPATCVGIYNYSDLSHSDSNEKSSPVNADLHVRYSLDAVEVGLQGYENHGITAFGAVPGNSALVAGQMAVYHTSGRTASEMVISEDVALKMNFIPDVKHTFSARNVAPMTRMGMAAILRAELQKAASGNDKNTMYDPSGDVFRRVLNKELPILCNVREHFDIETMLDLQKEFGFKLILMGAYQAASALSKIKDAGVSILLGDLIDNSYVTLFDADITALLDMSKTVPMAFSNNGSGYEGLLWSAEKAVRNGLGIDKAIDMMTVDTAGILGISDKTGSIEVGKYADIAIWSAHPLKTYDAHVNVCITAGKVWRAK